MEKTKNEENEKIEILKRILDEKPTTSSERLQAFETLATMHNFDSMLKLIKVGIDKIEFLRSVSPYSTEIPFCVGELGSSLDFLYLCASKYFPEPHKFINAGVYKIAHYSLLKMSANSLNTETDNYIKDIINKNDN